MTDERNHQSIGESTGESWDVLCIGCGITSLAFGAQIARCHPNKRILLLDKHYAPGGYATIFKRKSTRFDCSLHKLSGMSPEGNLQRILGELGVLDRLELVRPGTFFEAHHASGALRLSNDYPTFRAQLHAAFPEEKAGLDRFFEELEVHGKNGYYQYQILDGSYSPDIKQLRFAHKELRKLLASDAIAERVASPLLREILTTASVYVGGFAEDLSYLYYLHALYATLCCGNAYVRGGSQHLSNLLADEIRAAGGTVQLRTDVRRILVDEADRAYGVETDKGTFFAKRIYVNASPQYVLDELLPPLPCLAPTRQLVSGLKASWSTTTVYLVLDAPPADFGIELSEMMMLPDSPARSAELRRALRADLSNAALAEEALWAESPMEVTNYHALDPAGGMALCINVLDTIAQWPARKTPAYRPKKRRAAEVLIERLLRFKPALRGHIAYHDVSSPHTYRRYTNNHEGAGYGALVGTNVAAHTFHHRFPVGGLHFLSAWVAGSGYEAAFGFAEAKARRLEA